MTAEQGDTDDSGNVPSMSSKARESGRLQDMYRRTLAASWAAQVGELPADKCIEDIFNGGDGWGGTDHVAAASSPRIGGGSTEDESDVDHRILRGHKRNTAGTGSHETIKPSLRHRDSSKSDITMTAVRGRVGIAQNVHSGHTSEGPMMRRRANEIDEFFAREDLRSWEISTKSS